jgi:hypothetical protein
MALLIATTDTATSPATGTRTINPAPINFGADFRVTAEGANEVVLTNISTDMSRPETIRIAFTDVADIFKGSKIDPSPSVLAASKRGVSILTQLNGVGQDGMGTPYPFSANLVLKLPVIPNPDIANVTLILQRLLGTLYGTKDTTINARVAGLLRGALTPVEL